MTEHDVCPCIQTPRGPCVFVPPEPFKDCFGNTPALEEERSYHRLRGSGKGSGKARPIEK